MVNECIIEVPVFANNQRAHPRHAVGPVGSNPMGIGTTVFIEIDRKLTAQERVQRSCATDICIFFFFFKKDD